MTKVSGTYPSLSRGVNQQPFEARLDGQHGEQVNLWSDPVSGLSRRRGTVMQSRGVDNVFGPSYHSLSDADKLELREFYASYRTLPYTSDGLELQVHYPTKPQPAWMQPLTQGGQGGIRVTRKIQGAGPLQPGATIEDVGIGVVNDFQWEATRTAVFKGIAAACQVGRFMVFVPQSTSFTVPAEVDYWASAANSHWVVEIKQGIPNRTYTVSFLVDGTAYSYEYTTPSSSYSGTLSTADIPFSDPEYQKLVNDRVNAYNSAVTAWITTAAQQTRPAYIVDRLLAAGLATPLTAAGSSVYGGFIYNNQNVLVVYNTNGRTSNPSATDGGDNSTVAVVGDTVTSISALTTAHVYGKIVRVQPERGEASFYMKAVPKDANIGVWGSTRWEECPRTTQAAIASPFIIMAVRPTPSPGNPRVGMALGTAGGLAYLASGAILNDPTVLTLPSFNGRQVGDQDSSPSPRFFNRQITWMGMFQDRLCVAAGNTVDMSEVGNYFNFFRTQTLTVPDNDPVSIYALGSETDTIRHSVIFDRSLLLFGDNQQYSIDGRNPVTPSTSTVIQSSSIEDATDCPPVTGGSLVFFGKRREGSTEVFQMEVGDVTDTSTFTGLGLQLADYLPGKPAQLLFVASPSTLFVRCSEAPHSVFVFRFIDQNRQRVMDSWSRFDYHPAFGVIFGMFYHDDALYLRVAREAWKDADGTVWTGGRGDYGFDVLERQSLLPRVPGLPYLDSIREARAAYEGSPYGADWWATAYPFLATVFTKDKIANYAPTDPTPPPGQDWLQGATPNVVSADDWNTVFFDIGTRDLDYCVTGLMFDSYVDLTSPVRRDSNGQPIMQGRLTVGKLDVSYKDSCGFRAEITDQGGVTTALDFAGRVLEQSANMVGVVPVTTGNVAVFVGRESKDYVCTIKSRSWMPLSITRVTWTGQWFMNHRFI